MDTALYHEFVAVCAEYRLHFFDGDSQKSLLRNIKELHEEFDLDVELAESEGWSRDAPQGYHLALLRQVADRFYSMQRMCAAVVEPTNMSLRLLKKKPIFARLQDSDLRGFLVNWIARRPSPAKDSNSTRLAQEQMGGTTQKKRLKCYWVIRRTNYSRFAPF
jgi:hypothetical protein